MAKIELKNVTKSYGAVSVIKGIDLTVNKGEFMVFVGPSGCGKSTLLRLISGLEDITSGDLLFDGERVNNLIPSKRGIAMVFQSYALYPHMNVYDNMAFGLKLAKASPDDLDARVRDAARLLQIDHLLDRLPKQLSGGQRQRVAIGRAIVRNPDVFLFDEPLSNLDAKLRIEMRTEIKSLHRRLQTTVVYVTHDQVEAMTMADRVVVMNGGRIEQAADPITLYEKPRNLFVAAFIGAPSMNFIEGELIAGDGGLSFRAAGVNIPIPAARQGAYAPHVGAKVVAGIRPEHTVSGGRPLPTIELKLRDVEPLGPHTLLIGTAGGAPFTAQVAAQTKAAADDTALIPIDAEKMHLFLKESGAVIPV